MEQNLVLYRKKKKQRDIVYLLGGYYESKTIVPIKKKLDTLENKSHKKFIANINN
jgi:hypothetical protein